MFQLRRGPLFNAIGQQAKSLADSPLVEPLLAIGFDKATITRLLEKYPARMLEKWADMTLAAKERQGDTFFLKSPMAYFMNNIKEAAEGRRTPPDWWRELRKREREIERQQECSKLKLIQEQSAHASFDDYLQTEVREVFLSTMDRLSADLRKSGQSDVDARQNAEHMARLHFQNRFRRDHPTATRDAGPVSLRDYFGQR